MRKSILVTILIATGAVLGLGGCTPRDLETTPVVVQTPHGPVTCQLYTLDQVYWDRSIKRPDAMSAEVADNVCRAEGQRTLDERRRIVDDRRQHWDVIGNTVRMRYKMVDIPWKLVRKRPARHQVPKAVRKIWLARGNVLMSRLRVSP